MVECRKQCWAKASEIKRIMQNQILLLRSSASKILHVSREMFIALSKLWDF